MSTVEDEPARVGTGASAMLTQRRASWRGRPGPLCRLWPRRLHPTAPMLGARGPHANVSRPDCVR